MCGFVTWRESEVDLFRESVLFPVIYVQCCVSFYWRLFKFFVRRCIQQRKAKNALYHHLQTL